MENTCLICFDELHGKVKASPNTCDHVFCLPCLEKWSKQGSFCPIDRKRFRKIINLDSEQCIQVKPRKRKKEKTVYDFSTKCETCLNDNSPDVLLLCDCCDLAFHMFCLKPPLVKIPDGLWFCPTCISVEFKIKNKNGMTKELEADSGNAFLQGNEERNNVKNTTTEQGEQDYGEKSPNKGTGQNFIKFNGIQSVITEQYSSECKDVNVSSDSQDFSCSNISTCTNKTEEYSYEYTNNVEKKDLFHQKERHKKGKRKCSNIDEMCLNKTALQDNSMLGDNLFQEVAFGFMKEDLEDKNDVSETRFHLSCSNGKSGKSSHDFSFRTKVHKISSTNTEDSRRHSRKRLSRQKIRENADWGDLSDVNSLPSSSSVSLDYSKGTFKNLISDVKVKSGFETCLRLSDEIIKSNSTKGHDEIIEIKSTEGHDKIIESKSTEGHPKKRRSLFSVFESIEGKDASQKKYSEINSRTHIPFSANSNAWHCFQCKICEFKYDKNSLRNRKNLQSTKIQSQGLEPSNIVSTSKKPLNLNYKGNTKGNRMSAVERRQYSLLRKLKKIHNAKRNL